MKDIDKLAKGTHLSFNCPFCKEYWEDYLKLWQGLGTQLEGIHLVCPKCSPYQHKREW